MNVVSLNNVSLDGNIIRKGASGGGGNVSLMTEVTWQELKDLRDNGGLIAGHKYRMIDYDTYTSQEGTQSAMHPFDLILTALDEKTLSEECSAIQSARDVDGYYYNINLKSWDVRYCLDNDTKKYAWAVAPHLEVEAEGQKTNVPQVSFLEKLFNEQYQAIDIPQDTFGMYMDEQWYKLTAKAEIVNDADPVKALDVSILQDNLLGPVLGIADPRVDKRIDFGVPVVPPLCNIIAGVSLSDSTSKLTL